MKRSVTFLILLAAMALLTTSYSRGPYFGGTGNRTGSAGSNAGCDGVVCHAASGGSASLSIALLKNGVPVNSYTPGDLYRVRLTLPVVNLAHRNFGFQASIVRASDGVTQAGNLNDAGRADLSVYQDVLVQLVEHNRYLRSTPIAGNYIDTVSFGWQAPAAGTGSVRVFAVINAVDSNRGPGGDQPRAGFQDFRENTTNVGTGSLAQDVPLSVYPNPATGDGITLRGLRASQPLSVSITDLRGAAVLRREGIAGQDGTLFLALPSLPPGRFMLTVQEGGTQRSVSFQVK